MRKMKRQKRMHLIAPHKTPSKPLKPQKPKKPRKILALQSKQRNRSQRTKNKSARAFARRQMHTAYQERLAMQALFRTL